VRDTMHTRLRADGEVFRGTARSQAPDGPGRRGHRLRWAAPLAAAAAVVIVAAGTAFVLGGNDPAGQVVGDRPIPDPYPAPAHAVGRHVVAVLPNGPGAADDETASATVIAEDVAAGQSLLVYRREHKTCLRWQGPRSGSTACYAKSGDVTVDAVGPVLDRSGDTAGAPAVWGSVPTDATTVFIEASDGTSQRTQAVNGAPSGANFYLARFDVAAHPLSSVAAYDADGHFLRDWRAPATGVPHLGRIPTPPTVRAAIPSDPRVPLPGQQVDLLATTTEGPVTAGFVGWIHGATFCWARYVNRPSHGQAPAEPAACGPMDQNLNRLGFSRSLGFVVDGQLKQLVWGMAPAGTASVRLSASGKPTVTAAVNDAGAAWRHSRFFLATWPAKTKVTLTALAPNGQQLGIRTG
jgi:hypothetical protein